MRTLIRFWMLLGLSVLTQLHIKEKFTLVYNLRHKSGTGNADWAEKAIKVKGGEKNAGYTVGTGMLVGKPKEATVITIEAESGEEAAEALRKFYGESIVNDVCLAGKSSSLSEVKHQS